MIALDLSANFTPPRPAIVKKLKNSPLTADCKMCAVKPRNRSLPVAHLGKGVSSTPVASPGSGALPREPRKRGCLPLPDIPGQRGVPDPSGRPDKGRLHQPLDPRPWGDGALPLDPHRPAPRRQPERPPHTPVCRPEISGIFLAASAKAPLPVRKYSGAAPRFAGLTHRGGD